MTDSPLVEEDTGSALFVGGAYIFGSTKKPEAYVTPGRESEWTWRLNYGYQAEGNFKKRELEFMGQAGLALATVGAAATPSYNEGIAVFTVTRFGLMGEFTVSGARFTYQPLTE